MKPLYLSILGVCRIEAFMSDTDESPDDNKNFNEFMKKYRTELFTSASDESTDDDDEVYEEFMKKQRMKTKEIQKFCN